MKFKTNNSYLFEGNHFYTISLDTNSEINGLNENTKFFLSFNFNEILSTKPDCIGYIEEKENTFLSFYSPFYGRNLTIVFPDERQFIDDFGNKNEEDKVIIYTKTGSSIYFYYIIDKNIYNVNVGNIEDHISCKLVDSG